MAKEEQLPIIIRDRKFMISDVSFYYGKNKDGSPSAVRMVWCKYIDYGKVSGFGMQLDALKKDPNFVKKSEEEIKEELLWRYLTQTTTLI